jgi:hypothetical protein
MGRGRVSDYTPVGGGTLRWAAPCCIQGAGRTREYGSTCICRGLAGRKCECRHPPVRSYGPRCLGRQVIRSRRGPAKVVCNDTRDGDRPRSHRPQHRPANCPGPPDCPTSPATEAASWGAVPARTRAIAASKRTGPALPAIALVPRSPGERRGTGVPACLGQISPGPRAPAVGPRGQSPSMHRG